MQDRESDVSVSSSPTDNLPAAESLAIQNANQATSTAPTVQTNNASVTTVPPTQQQVKV
jgi:hypothetical protein